MYTWLEPGRLFMDYGPIQMTISAFNFEEPLNKEMEEACYYAAEQLKELASVISIAKLPSSEIREERLLPDVLKKMIKAVKECGDLTLTPMATVAGTFADKVADYIAARGATKVIVNNGGDIALRLANGESTKVGIVSDINHKSFSHIITLDSDSGIGGIATSGFRGRSLTKGIASAAVAFGRTCREADAAATLIGNYTYSDDSGIKQVLAEYLDPDTDIVGHLVTLSIGDLDPQTPSKALDNGIAKVRELVAKKSILGAAIFLNNESRIYPEFLAEQIAASHN
ncbi:MAG: hypothetical protein APF76_10735 [Desulfitibacter sp. BRH_c19]|nr:MAG: hypothetical protein APF76_10735 [Desulfitibacter sp. BRH_c19]